MRKYAIYGAGAFGQEVWLIIRDIIKAQNIAYEFIGFIDDFVPAGTKLKYGTVVGNVDYLNNINYEIDLAIAINNPKIIKDKYETQIKNQLVKFPNYIHPTVSYFDKDSVTTGKGNIITHLGVFSFDIKLGDFNILNTRATLGHHVEIGSFNVLNPNAQISGNVKIGDQNILGLNVGVIPGKTIGNKNTIGAGSILIRSIKDDSLYMGNPALKIKFN